MPRVIYKPHCQNESGTNREAKCVRGHNFHILCYMQGQANRNYWEIECIKKYTHHEVNSQKTKKIPWVYFI